MKPMDVETPPALIDETRMEAYPDYHLVTAAGATHVWPRFHGS